MARLAILSYHKVGEPAPGGWDTWYYVPQVTFGRHLEQLRETGWQLIDTARVVSALRGGHALPPRAAHVTFDDGYRLLLEYALPVMSEYECPATVFVPTDYVGSYNEFDYGSSREPREAICSWDELAQLEAAGVSVQSHGASHRSFSDLDAEEVEDELVRSKTTIEERLGAPVEVLSFPYGDGGVDPEAVTRQIERSGYRAACLYGGGPFDPAMVDPFRLTRIAIGSDTDLLAELA